MILAVFDLYAVSAVGDQHVAVVVHPRLRPAVTPNVFTGRIAIIVNIVVIHAGVDAGITVPGTPSRERVAAMDASVEGLAIGFVVIVLAIRGHYFARNRNRLIQPHIVTDGVAVIIRITEVQAVLFAFLVVHGLPAIGRTGDHKVPLGIVHAPPFYQYGRGIRVDVKPDIIAAHGVAVVVRIVVVQPRLDGIAVVVLIAGRAVVRIPQIYARGRDRIHAGRLQPSGVQHVGQQRLGFESQLEVDEVLLGPGHVDRTRLALDDLKTPVRRISGVDTSRVDPGLDRPVRRDARGVPVLIANVDEAAITN